MLIDGYKLPDDIEYAVVVDLLENIHPEDIIRCVRGKKHLSKGYSLHSKNAEIFRRRIKKELMNCDGELDVRLREILFEYSLLYPLLKVVSEKYMAEYFYAFLHYYTYEQVVISYLLCPENDALRSIVYSELEQRNFEKEKDDIELSAEYVKKLIAFLSPLAYACDFMERRMTSSLISRELSDENEEGEFDFEDDEDDECLAIIERMENEHNQKLNEITKQLNILKVELKSASEYEKKARKLSRTVREMNEKIQKLENNAKNERQKLKQREQELKAAKSEIETLKADTELRIRDGVAGELKARIHNWIQVPEKTNEYIETAGKSIEDLLTYSETVLEKQQKKDKHTGNLALLRKQLGELTDRRNKIAIARVESLNPIPELSEAEKALQTKIEEIKKILGESSSDAISESAEKIRMAINESINPDELKKAVTRLARINEAGILSGNELRILYKAYHDKQERMYDQLLVSSSTAVTVPSSLAWRFKYAVDKNQPFVWMLDGHNILFRLCDIFGCDENGVPDESARKKLIQTLKDMVDNTKTIDVIVFFDGPAYSEQHAAPNVKIIYSGGKGEHRADNVILEKAEYEYKNNPDIVRVLVSDDNDLIKKVGKFNVSGMSSCEFAAVIERN